MFLSVGHPDKTIVWPAECIAWFSYLYALEPIICDDSQLGHYTFYN